MTLRGGADVAALRRVLAGGNGTEIKKIVLLKPPRKQSDNALLAWAVNNLNPHRQWRRLSDTCRWADGLITVDEIDKRPPHAVSANLAIGLLIVPAVLAPMAIFCFLGINLLNRNWLLGEYLGTTKVIDVFAYQIRHFIVAALHLKLTEESAVFLASVATETAVVACYVGFCCVRMKSGAAGQARREFTTYIAATALFKLNYVSWLVACCIFVLGLIGPSDWFREHGLALTLASFGACAFPTGLRIYVANRRRLQKSLSSAKDYLIPSVYSWFVAIGVGFAVMAWPGVFPQAFEPRVTLKLTDACYSEPVGCTVDVLPENLPSPIVLDELHFNVNVQFMDARGFPIENGAHGTSASFRMQHSSTDTEPLYVSEEGQSHGVVVSPRFICPPAWQGPDAPKLLIPRSPVYVRVRLADAPSMDYEITVRVDFDNNYASLFRSAGSGCLFWP
ncbi:hypothetical protein [Paraburkholderia sp. WSM4174]|uniref:hypothetical protein n=1 Tax=Paraburkholderia sp. WSM4174 TaxID=2991071 RepID=UPI003D1EA4B1